MLEQLSQINFGELITAASLAGAGVVTLVTQWLKYIPTQYTSGKWAVYVNVALSFLASLVVRGFPAYDGTDIVAFLVQWGVIALASAFAYRNLLKPAITKPQGNV